MMSKADQDDLLHFVSKKEIETLCQNISIRSNSEVVLLRPSSDFLLDWAEHNQDLFASFEIEAGLLLMTSPERKDNNHV